MSAEQFPRRSDRIEMPPPPRAASPVFFEPRAAYVHVPFCAHRCGYCDFTVVAGRDDLIGDYLGALGRELAALGRRRTVDTLFLGGGTPTHLPPRALSRLMELLRSWFSLAPEGELSVEANPADLDSERIAVLAEAGVNRVSLGVQSLHSPTLAVLERDHGPSDVAAALERVRKRIDNVGFDLIFAVPGQSTGDWERTLREAVRLEPSHISTYGLTFEKGTAFWTRRMKGALREAPEERQRTMYAAAMDRLPAAGYEHYEISNFARPGRRCRHNEVYWRALPYFGFGPGAAWYIDGVRATNHRSVTTWLKRIRAGESPVAEVDRLAPEQRAREALALGLRRIEGVKKPAFRELTGFDLGELAGRAIARLQADGLLAETETRLRLTREGVFLADTVCAGVLS